MKAVGGEGLVLRVGRELGRGGEGAVYEVADRPDLVAKVYHRAPGPERSAKLAAMTSLRMDRLLRVAAWPVETLHDRPAGPIIGLLMPRITGFKAIHNLYGPKTRLAEYPNANWQFLVHAAANLARAFAVIHDHGHVIGDVNHGNAVVSSKAMVTLIDCDSFQIAANGRHYPCEVGVSTHQPPELQGLPSFRGLVRTPNHDNFGLAVLIFQLLMMGRHPFAGRYLGSGDMPIERAILEHRFAYGGVAASRQMQAPPHTLTLAALSPPVVALLERAFSPEGNRNTGRPAAVE